MRLTPVIPLCMALCAALAGCAKTGGVRLRTDLENEPVATNIAVSFNRVLGERGSGQGQFFRPAGVSVNPQDHVFVVDMGNERIQRLDETGAFVSEIGGFGWDAYQFNRPTGISAEDGLEIWVADRHNRRLVHLDGDLHWIRVIRYEVTDGVQQDLGYPADVAPAADGTLWFTDQDTDRLRSITPFVQVAEETSGRLGTGELSDPTGIAIGPDGTIYVADTGHDRVVVYDQFGTMQRTIGERFLSRPCGIDVNWFGDVVIADTGNNRVVLANRLGHLVGMFGSEGTDPGQFRNPTDAAFDTHNRLWVADRDNHRLQILNLDRDTD